MMTGRALQNRLPSALFLVLAGITLGAISTYLYLSHARTTWDSEWHDLVLTREGFGYTTEALVFSDIPLPEIKKVSGTWKFIQRTPSTSGSVEIGYLIHVLIDKLDTSKIPEKYRKETPIGVKPPIGRFVLPPVSEVDYKAHLELMLEDKDGFTLLSLSSGALDILSGQDNVFQGIIEQQVPVGTAALTRAVVLNLLIDKCATCGSR